jgi:DcaP outer membrane protein
MRRLILAATLVLVFPMAGRADELSDLKAQLDAAMKSIQSLQQRVEALEAEKAKAAGPPAPAEAKAAPAPEAAPAAAVAAGAPVVAPDSVAGKGAPDANKARLEISGKVQLDTIYDFKLMNPQWAATERPSQIPVTCPGDPGCGKDGSTIFSIRQTAIAFKGYIPTSAGELKTDLSFDLFGTGGGNTQARVLNAWGELGPFGLGQYYSLFMNFDTFPNVIDYWGPSGMVFLRNPQVRYTPIDHDGTRIAFSLEAPNAALDTGKVSEVDPTLGVEPWTRYPDLVGSYRLQRDWGQFQASAILRSVGYQTTTSASGNPSGSVTGWGINLNGWFNTIGKDRIVGQLVYGHAIASYMNDGGVDVAPNANLQAEAVPSLGGFVYYDHYWNEQLSTSLGFSAHHQDNTAGQLGNAFKQGSYASTNLLWTPIKNVLGGVELLWGKLQQFNSESAEDVRVQFTGQYKF